MTTLVDPRGLRIDWAELTNEQVARHLNDTRFQVRERAIVECVNRAENIVPTLARALGRRDIRERLGSVWALTRMLSERTGPEAEIQKAIRLALGDRKSSIRLAATRSLSTYPDPLAYSELAKTLHEDNAAIRREAAKALGRLGDVKAIPVLLESLSSGPDRGEEHAIIYALLELGDVEQIQKGLVHASPNAKRGSLIAILQIDASKLKLNDLAPLLASNDDRLSLAAPLDLQAAPKRRGLGKVRSIAAWQVVGKERQQAEGGNARIDACLRGPGTGGSFDRANCWKIPTGRPTSLMFWPVEAGCLCIQAG